MPRPAFRAVKQGGRKKSIHEKIADANRPVPSAAVGSMIRRRLGKKALQNTKDKTRANLGLGKMY